MGWHALRVSEYFSNQAIRFFPAGLSVQETIEELIRLMDLPDPDTALKAVLAREETGPTIVAPGLALPHARLSGFPRIAAAVGICRDGIPSSSGEPIRLFILFLSSKEKTRDHLMFLAAVSSLLQTEGLTAAILQSPTSEAVLEKIREAERAL